MLPRLIFIALFMVSLVSSNMAKAQQAPFVFNVNVRVNELHKQVQKVHVRCAVYSKAAGAAIGMGENEQILNSGKYIGIVPVSVNMFSGQSQSDARRYACRLRLILPGAEPAKPSPQAKNIALRPIPGGGFKPLISGDL